MAVLAEERPWPVGGRSGDVGLFAMYASIVAALLGSFVEEWAAQGLVRRWRKAGEATAAQRRSGAAEPLLGASASCSVDGKEVGSSGSEQQQQHSESATIAALVKLAAPDTPILLLAFTAGAAAALGQASTGRGAPACTFDI